jgi:hypothetical protein
LTATEHHQLEHQVLYASSKVISSTLHQRDTFVAAATSELQLRQEAVEHLTGALVWETCRVYALQTFLEERDDSIPQLDHDTSLTKGSRALCHFCCLFDQTFLYVYFCCRVRHDLDDPSGGRRSPAGRP